MPNYYLHIATGKKGQTADYNIAGPFKDQLKAHHAGVPYAEEGLDVEVHIEEGIVICDFCSDPEVRWAYNEVEDFHAGDPRLHWGSRGGWAACDHCHDLVEADKRDELAEYSMNQFYKMHPETPDTPYFRTQFTEQIKELHKGFFANRRGGAVPE